MNLARVEYYFADLLSILEMPSRSEWLVDIVSSPWPNDPKKLEKGKLRLPGNLWYQHLWLRIKFMTVLCQ